MLECDHASRVRPNAIRVAGLSPRAVGALSSTSRPLVVVSGSGSRTGMLPSPVASADQEAPASAGPALAATVAGTANTNGLVASFWTSAWTASGLAARTASTNTLASLTQAVGASLPLAKAAATAAEAAGVTAKVRQGFCAVTRSAAASTTGAMPGATATRTVSPAAAHEEAVVTPPVLDAAGRGATEPGVVVGLTQQEVEAAGQRQAQHEGDDDHHTGGPLGRHRGGVFTHGCSSPAESPAPTRNGSLLRTLRVND